MSPRTRTSSASPPSSKRFDLREPGGGSARTASRVEVRAIGLACLAFFGSCLAGARREGGRDVGAEDVWSGAGGVQLLGVARRVRVRSTEEDAELEPCEVGLERLGVRETTFPTTGAGSGLGARWVPPGAGSGPGPCATAWPPSPTQSRPAATRATSKRACGEPPEPALPKCRRHQACRVTNTPPVHAGLCQKRY